MDAGEAIILEIEENPEALELYNREDPYLASHMLRLSLTLPGLPTNPHLLNKIPEYVEEMIPQVEMPKNYQSNNIYSIFEIYIYIYILEVAMEYEMNVGESIDSMDTKPIHTFENPTIIQDVNFEPSELLGNVIQLFDAVKWCSQPPIIYTQWLLNIVNDTFNVFLQSIYIYIYIIYRK